MDKCKHNKPEGACAVCRSVKRMVAEVMAKTVHNPPKARPARLDPKGDAKPLTSLHAHVKPSVCFGPGSTPESYELRDQDPHAKRP